MCGVDLRLPRRRKKPSDTDKMEKASFNRKRYFPELFFSRCVWESSSVLSRYVLFCGRPKRRRENPAAAAARPSKRACRIAEESGTTANRQTPPGGLLSLSSLFLFVCLFVSLMN